MPFLSLGKNTIYIAIFGFCVVEVTMDTADILHQEIGDWCLIVHCLDYIHLNVLTLKDNLDMAEEKAL